MGLAELYPLVRAGHIGLALLSGGLFVARGVGVLLGVAAAMAPRVRRASQVIDTALLAAALLLLAILGLDPFTTPWLQAKLVLLVAYIVFGTLALRRSPTRAGKALAFAAALCCYAMLLAIARTHDPLGFVRMLGA